ncbi:MAG TPA: tetratricopeptide repeat protein [Chloroflexi bacterium]|nr:tetratricopeptide repeat protein [Chloroflexota bacterium]
MKLHIRLCISVAVLSIMLAGLNSALPTPAYGETPLLSFYERLWQKAINLKEEGRCPQAAPLFQVLINSPTPYAPDALFHLAECLEMEEDWPQAAAAWRKFTHRYKDDPRMPGALFRLGNAYRNLQNYGAAIQVFLHYVSLDAPLADLAWEAIGDAYVELGRYEAAIRAYNEALQVSPTPWGKRNLQEKMAQAYLKAGDFPSAAAVYEKLLSQAPDLCYRAKVDYLLGNVLLQMGRAEDAYARFLDAVWKAPAAEHSYLALIQLVEAGVKVDDYQRGLVDYYACSSYPAACGAAVMAFQRYILAHPKDHKAEAHYYAALAYRTAGNYEAALKEWDWLIYTHPGSSLVPEGWWEKGRTFEWMGDLDEAIATYRKLADLHPDSPYALKALWRMAQLLERQGELRAASEAYLKAAEREKDETRQADALFQAGLALYRAGDFEGAADLWDRLNDQGDPRPARALFWLGKAAYAQGKFSYARSHWQKAASEAPSSYYGLRASVRLRKFEIAGCRQLPPPGPPTDLPEKLLTWVSVWSPYDDLPTPCRGIGSPKSRSPGEIKTSEPPHSVRAKALLEAGLRREALALYESIRREYQGDAPALACLAIRFLGEKLYAPSIRSALSLIHMAEEAGAPPPPICIQRIAYPLHYANLIQEEACAVGMDPLFLAAVIHQESLFDPTVSSWAGAVGLMQIMPTTGQGIAKALRWDDYRERDLQKPFLSVKFGVWYLKRQRERFGDWLVALAAYNGGPGNAARWWEEAQGDPDLFVELISLDETKEYVKRIYERYATYRRLYSAS